MARRADIIHRSLLLVLSLGVAGLVGWTAWSGWEYYSTPVAERPHHELFRTYRPAGSIGHGLGILGSLMVLLLLTYSWRKRARSLRGWGDLRIWLRYHIFLGISGPTLITLHTSGKVDGLVAISFWSMTAVAISGVFGRYLYQQIPRNVLGESISLEDFELKNESYLVELSSDYRMDEKALAELEELALGTLRKYPAPVALLVLPLVNIFLVRRLHRWAAGSDVPTEPRVSRLARSWVLQTRRLHLFHQIRDLFHYWHVFHKPFAVIMILIMVVHVAVALAFGYTWVF